MLCPNCQNPLAEGAKFCGSCGTPVPVQPAPQPEAPRPAPEAFAAPIITPPEQPPVQSYAAPEQPFAPPASPFTPPAPAPKPPRKPKMPKAGAPGKKLPVKPLIIGAAAVVLVAIIIALVGILLGGSGSDSVFYIRDREIFYNDFSKNAPYQITSRLVYDDDDVDNEDLADVAYVLSVILSEDGSKALFIDRIDESSDGPTLYYRELNKPEDSAAKIDSDVAMCQTNDALTRILYLKNDSLYIHNLEQKEKLAGDIFTFFASEDLKIIYYITLDGELYCCIGDEKEKIDSDLDVDTYDYRASCYFSEDYKTVYYTDEDDNLYKKSLDGEREKLASDVGSVYNTVDGIYYMPKENQPTVNFIQNDTDTEDWESSFEYSTVNVPTELFFHDGKETFTICQAADFRMANSRMVVYRDMSDAGQVSFPLSKIAAAAEEANDSLAKTAESMIEGIYEEYESCSVVINGVVSTLEVEEYTSLHCTSDGSTVYISTDHDADKDVVDLYRAEIKNDQLGTPELYDTDVSYVYYVSLRIFDEDCVTYFKDLDDSEGDLYINGECVDYAVNRNYLAYDRNSGKLYYLTDYNEDKEYGTLKVFDGKTDKVVADDVTNFTILGNGNVLYLYDYSLNSYKGDLYLYKNGKAEMIDSEVIALLNASLGATRKSYR